MQWSPSGKGSSMLEGFMVGEEICRAVISSGHEYLKKILDKYLPFHINPYYANLLIVGNSVICQSKVRVE